MLRFAVTSDLHFGIRHLAGHAANLQLVAALLADPPDVLVLAGDIGAGDDFERCLALFDKLDCVKLFVPGNHDIWVNSQDARGDSLAVYAEVLPRIGREHGFHCLDSAPWRSSADGVAVVGTMNWYDHSWGEARLLAEHADAEDRLRRKEFRRGMHNDANFVHWPHTDKSFTKLAVERFSGHLSAILAEGLSAIVVTHHPPLFDLCYPHDGPMDLDALLWLAFSGNAVMEATLRSVSASIPFVFCGHTHRARECKVEGMQGINVGGDYHFKRLARFDWPGGAVRYEEFGMA